MIVEEAKADLLVAVLASVLTAGIVGLLYLGAKMLSASERRKH